MNRMVQVNYYRNGPQTADYGPFLSPAHLAAWLEKVDADARFGEEAGRIEMTIRYCAPPDVPEPRKQQQSRRRTKQPVAS